MLNLKQEIEKFLSLDWMNTNNKEQNFQGRLYAYLLHLEQWGYVVEMETNWKELYPEEQRDTLPSLEKSEIDILVYTKDKSKKYAAELKWFYHPDFHYFDYYDDYKEDFIFTKQLVEVEGYDEACCILIVDPKKMTKPRSNRNNYNQLRAFEYQGHNKLAYIQIDNDTKIPIRWKDLLDKTNDEEVCYYYISSFVSKWNACDIMSQKIDNKYRFRTAKSFSLADASSWYNQLQEGIAVTQEEIDTAFEDVCKEIDSNQID